MNIVVIISIDDHITGDCTDCLFHHEGLLTAELKSDKVLYLVKLEIDVFLKH